MKASGRSVAYFGIRVCPEVLSACGLYLREIWIRSSVGVEQPLPCDPGRLMWTRPPSGWERVPLAKGRRARHTQRRVERSFFSQLCAIAWSESFSKGSLLHEYRVACRSTGVQDRYRAWRSDGKKFRLLVHRRRPCQPATCPCRRYRAESYPGLWSGVPPCGRGLGCAPGKKGVWAVKPLVDEIEDGPEDPVDSWNRTCLLSGTSKSWRPSGDLGMSLPAFQR